MAQNEAVREVAKPIIFAGGVKAVDKGIDKLLNNQSMSFEKKLSKLEKLRKSSKITEDEYVLLRKKLIDAQ